MSAVKISQVWPSRTARARLPRLPPEIDAFGLGRRGPPTGSPGQSIFAQALSSRRGKQAVTEEVREVLGAESGALRDDLTALRG